MHNPNPNPNAPLQAKSSQSSRTSNLQLLPTSKTRTFKHTLPWIHTSPKRLIAKSLAPYTQENNPTLAHPPKPTMSLWQSYRNLSPRTRLFIGGGVMAYAAFGLFASDQAEQLLGWTATDEDRKRLKEEQLPRVHMVDKREK